MIDIAWSEFLFIALLALILIGPNELPSVLRNIGRWVGKMRTFVKDFSNQLDLHTAIDEEKDNVTILQNNTAPKNEKISGRENTKS